jgi:excisionase family DNA binding protein
MLNSTTSNFVTAHSGNGATYEGTARSFAVSSRLEDLPDFLTAEQAAELLQVSMNTMRSLLVSGEIPAIKVRRFWRINKTQLIAHLVASSQVCK